MVLFFTHIPLAVNHTIKATPPERLQQYHTIFLQETWLAKQTLDKLTDISDIHFACGTAEVDYTKGITSGRPYGWTAILWNKKLNAKIVMNQDQSIIGLEVCLDSSSLNFLNVYMPYCCDSNYDEYINYLSKISTLCDETDSPNVFIVGDLLALITILVNCYPNSAWNMN